MAACARYGACRPTRSGSNDAASLEIDVACQWSARDDAATTVRRDTASRARGVGCQRGTGDIVTRPGRGVSWWFIRAGDAGPRLAHAVGMHVEDRITGCLLGGAVGDAIGLPWEGLGRAQVEARVGAGPLRHALVCGRGMISDDTEHACMTAQALLAARGDPRRFARSLAWRLRGWLLGLPASVGWGTLRAL